MAAGSARRISSRLSALPSDVRLLAAGLYATMAYGLAVIYGVMRIINLAHAGIMMLGAYVTFTLFTRFGLDPFLSLVVVVPLFFLFGVVLYRGVVRRLPRSSGGAVDGVASPSLRRVARPPEPGLRDLDRRHPVDPDLLHDEVGPSSACASACRTSSCSSRAPPRSSS